MNFFEESHQAVEAPTMNPKLILAELKMLLRRSEGQAIEGTKYALATAILEQTGNEVPKWKVWEFITTYLQPWALKELFDGSNVVAEKCWEGYYRFKLSE